MFGGFWKMTLNTPWLNPKRPFWRKFWPLYRYLIAFSLKKQLLFRISLVTHVYSTIIWVPPWGALVVNLWKKWNLKQEIRFGPFFPLITETSSQKTDWGDPLLFSTKKVTTWPIRGPTKGGSDIGTGFAKICQITHPSVAISIPLSKESTFMLKIRSFLKFGLLHLL